MKKHLLSFLMIGAVGVFSAQAQITVTDTDIVGVGDDVEVAHDTIPGAITIGSGGASQTWNFSSINEDELDTLKFRAPAGYPGAVDFPLSNMVLIDSGEDSTWMYLTKNATGLYVDGAHQIESGQPVSLPFVSTIITFPSTMGTSFSGNWMGEIFKFPLGVDPDGPGPHGTVDSLRITRDANLSSNIDGWGTVTTPFGSFASLRQLVEEQTIDTTWQLVNNNWEIMSTTTQTALAGFGFNLDKVAYDTTRQARWWSDDANTGFPVVEMDYEANGTVNNIDWLKSTPTVGISESVEVINGFGLYPNPAKDNVTILTEEVVAGRVDVMDVTGKLVASQKITSNKTMLSVEPLDNGVYFYNIIDVNGSIQHTAKFVVAK